jgi:putative membrane protein
MDETSQRRSEFAALTAVLAVAAAWSAIRPVNPKDYLLEIAVPVAAFALLAATRRRFEFTPLAYRLLFCEALILIVGAHYTHEGVPLFDWLKPLFGWERNHYDRFAHFAVGALLVIPGREVLRRRTPLTGGCLNALAVVSILAFAAFYEITEWWIALGAAPEAAVAYLGSQGDPWDAQKDMLMDGLGALAGIALFSRPHDRALSHPSG